MLTAALALLLTVTPAAAQPAHNVIFITWDGVRWQDFFHRGDDAAFPLFWSRYAPNAVVLGEAVPFEASNAAIKSLPAYQEMMVGAATACDSNLCGRVKEQTLVDRLVALGLGQHLAVVGSWGTLEAAASSRPLPFVDVGLHAGESRPPWGDARKDRDTWARAMSALEARPRFLWISLNDADEWGHRDSRENYLAQLKRYDIWFDALMGKLKAMPGYQENTTVVVTTDHGRGDGKRWVEHGADVPEARRAFAFALAPAGTGQGEASRQGGNHRQLRGTIEALLGLAPSGATLAAFLPPAVATH